MRKEITRDELKDYPHIDIDLSKDIDLYEGVNMYYPAEIIVTLVEEEGGKFVYQKTDVILVHPTQRIVVWKHDRDKKYHIECTTTPKLPRTNYYDIKCAKEGLTVPNQIGVFSAKKFLDWVNYLEDVYMRVKETSDRRVQDEIDFRKSLELLPDIKWHYKGNKQGTVVRNGIQFEFCIADTHISRKIEVHYNTSNTVETFLKLSDNGYSKV